MTDTGPPPVPLSIEKLSVRLSGNDIVSDVSVLARAGCITGIIGPNGSGKSTLLRTVYRHVSPTHGRIVVGDRDLSAMSTEASARLVAAVPQEREGAPGATVRDVVALGRIPHQSSFRRESSEDRAVIDRALADVEIEDLAARTFQSLSGGEKQRALLARCFAQGAGVFVLDEPTNHLDLAHQVQMLALLERTGCTCLITLHDLGVAAAVCDEVHVLSKGAIVASGPPSAVLTGALLRDVFGVRAAIGRHPLTGGVQISVDYLSEAT
ncbi:MULTISPECIES: ABC transporter ATP-binding protein [unclassified Rhodococcus (in: high G+C Gram-positive bacteria)]|uniref:ABC transporter ATP-binding protein n=2 Tax=Rhodococcus TaxID=1827 RepID=UPI000A6DB2F3|nr:MULTISPECIES: ABC transporter ATP-binding protein [unclassified Rhodococcus (in: high G+C Gram-positive bacteria)]